MNGWRSFTLCLVGWALLGIGPFAKDLIGQQNKTEIIAEFNRISSKFSFLTDTESGLDIALVPEQRVRHGELHEQLLKLNEMMGDK